MRKRTYFIVFLTVSIMSAFFYCNEEVTDPPTNYTIPPLTTSSTTTKTLVPLETPDADEIVGYVADYSDGTPLEGVTIRVGNLSTQTDTEGKFSLKGVADGYITIYMIKDCYAIRGQTINKQGGVTLRKSMSYSPSETQYQTCYSSQTSSEPEQLTEADVCASVFKGNNYLNCFYFSMIGRNFYMSQNMAPCYSEVTEGVYSFSVFETEGCTYDGALQNLAVTYNYQVSGSDQINLAYNFSDSKDHITLTGFYENELDIVNNYNHELPVASALDKSGSLVPFAFNVFDQGSEPVILACIKVGAETGSTLKSYKGPYSSSESSITFDFLAETKDITINYSANPQKISWKDEDAFDLIAVQLTKYYVNPITGTSVASSNEYVEITDRNFVEIPSEVEMEPDKYYSIYVLTFDFDELFSMSTYLAEGLSAASYRENYLLLRNPFNAASPLDTINGTSSKNTVFNETSINENSMRKETSIDSNFIFD